MTSSNRPHRRRTGFVLWPAILLVLIAAAYSFAWFHYAGVIRAKTVQALASFGRGGATFDCGNSRVEGFPLEFTFNCDAVRYADPDRGSFASTSALHASAKVYDPRRVEVEFIGPSQAEAPGLGRIELNWQALSGFLPLTNRPSEMNLQGEDLTAGRVDQGAPDATPLLQLASFGAAAKLKGTDVDVTGRFAGLGFGKAIPDAKNLPPLSGDADILFHDGLALIAPGQEGLRGRSARINRLSLMPSPDSGATLTGKVDVDADGLVNAKLNISVRNPAELAQMLKDAFPENGDQIEAASSMLSALGNAPTIPIRIRRGKVSIGFLNVGRIPPLR